MPKHVPAFYDARRTEDAAGTHWGTIGFLSSRDKECG